MDIKINDRILENYILEVMLSETEVKYLSERLDAKQIDKNIINTVCRIPDPDDPKQTFLSTRRANEIKAILAYTISNVGGQRLSSCRGTLFGAYNGLIGYLQNSKQYSNPEAKMKSLHLNGQGAIHRNNAVRIANKYYQIRRGNPLFK